MKLEFSNSQELKDYAYSVSQNSNGKIKINCFLHSLAKNKGYSTSKQYLEHLDSVYNQFVNVTYDDSIRSFLFDTSNGHGCLKSGFDKREEIPVYSIDSPGTSHIVEELVKYPRWYGFSYFDSLANIVLKRLSFFTDCEFRNFTQGGWLELIPNEDSFLNPIKSDVQDLIFHPDAANVMRFIFNDIIKSSNVTISDDKYNLESELNELYADVIIDVLISLFCATACSNLSNSPKNKSEITESFKASLNNKHYKADFMLSYILPSNFEHY